MRYSRESDGAFDITVGPLMKAWGFFRGEGRVPTGRASSRAARRASATSTSSWTRPTRTDPLRRAGRRARSRRRSPRATPSIAWSDLLRRAAGRGRAGQRGRQHDLRHGCAAGVGRLAGRRPGSARRRGRVALTRDAARPRAVSRRTAPRSSFERGGVALLPHHGPAHAAGPCRGVLGGRRARRRRARPATR